MRVIQVGCHALIYLTLVMHAQSVQSAHNNQSSQSAQSAHHSQSVQSAHHKQSTQSVHHSQSVQSPSNQSLADSGANHLYKRMGKKSKQVNTKMNNKSHKTSQTSTDDEMTFLDQQIRENNVRTHYNEKILDRNNQYLPTLYLALTFATGVFQGINIEVENWLKSKSYFSEYAQLVDDFHSGRPSEERYKRQDSVMDRLTEKATSTRAIWYMYTVGLTNLIRFDKPHPAYYELVVNVFMDIDLTKIHEYINSYILHNQKSAFIRTSAMLKLTRSEMNQFMETSTILKVINLMNKVLDIDVLDPGFVGTLAEIVNESQEILLLKSEFLEKHSIFDYAAELMTKLQFIKLLLPLVTGNSMFVEKLNNMRNIKPKMNAYKKGDDIELISQEALDDFHGTIKARFLTEWYLTQSFESIYLQ